MAFNDRNGYHKQAGAKITYAHHITFSRSDYDLNKLSFGVSGGMVNSQLDQSEFGNNYDPSINGSDQKFNYFNVSILNPFAFISLISLSIHDSGELTYLPVNIAITYHF